MGSLLIPAMPCVIIFKSASASTVPSSSAVAPGKPCTAVRAVLLRSRLQVDTARKSMLLAVTKGLTALCFHC